MTASCQIAAELSDRIYGFIESHKSLPWRQWWISKTYNPLTEVRYKGINHFLTMMHMEEYALKVPQFLTFKQVKTLGWIVKPWEKSVPIIFFKSYIKKTEEDASDDRFELVSDNAVHIMGHKPAPKSKVPNFFLRNYRLYGLEQTTLPLETHDQNYGKNPTAEDHNELLKIIQDYCDRERLDVTCAGLRAYYTPSKDSIQIPRRENFERIEDFYFTLIHELIHSTGHRDRLARFKSSSEMEEGRKEQYAYEEIVADMGASLLMRQFNINPDLPNSAVYISWWLSYWKDKKSQLYRAARDAQRAVDFICNTSAWGNTERITV